jgi:anti-sigma factor RsiW
MKRLDEETLSCLHDEELDPAEAESLRAEIEADPAAGARLTAYSELGELVRGTLDRAADAADLERIWPAVASRIAESPRLTAWQALREWLGLSMASHPLRWVTASAAAVLLAVVCTVALLSHTSPGIRETLREPVSHRVDIEGLEFKGRHPDIFKIKNDQGETTVIWVYPDGDEEDGSEPGKPPVDGPEDI